MAYFNAPARDYSKLFVDLRGAYSIGDYVATAKVSYQGSPRGTLPTYDAASLLRDAFLSWEEEQELDWAVRYWEAARRAKLPVDDDFGEFVHGHDGCQSEYSGESERDEYRDQSEG